MLLLNVFVRAYVGGFVERFSNKDEKTFCNSNITIMGQTTSAQQVQTDHTQFGGYGNHSDYKNSILTNAQLSDNIENLFRSQNSMGSDSIQIKNSNRMMSTSAVDVDTIINGMKGGNNSRISVVPKRQ